MEIAFAGGRGQNDRLYFQAFGLGRECGGMQGIVTGKWRRLEWGLALVLALWAGGLRAQASLPVPAETNGVSQATSTNLPPPVLRPVPPIRVDPGGVAAYDLFGVARGGKFGIAGRTLSLPAPTNAPTVVSPWRRQIDFGMGLTRGNTDSVRYSGALDVVRETERSLLRLRTFGASGKSEGQRDAQNLGASERIERMLTESWYALQTLDYWRDTIAELDYRVTGIVSPGLRVVRTPTARFNVEAGGGYVEERKEADANGFAAARLAFTAERILNPFVLAWCGAEYLPRIDNLNIYFVNAEAGITVAMPPRLSLNTTLRQRYDSRPSEDKSSEDLALTTAVSARF